MKRNYIILAVIVVVAVIAVVIYASTPRYNDAYETNPTPPKRTYAPK